MSRRPSGSEPRGRKPKGCDLRVQRLGMQT